MRSNLRNFNNKLIYTCLIVLSFFALALKPKADIRYVNNLNDFKVHTTNHIQNVYRLGMHLYFQNRDTLFKDVPISVIREKLLKHDYEKLASIKDLQSLGYDQDKTLTERLYDFYGSSKQNNSKIPALITELNSYAQRYDNLFFRKYGYLDQNGRPNLIAMKIQLIEKIADIVEREKNPITPEEMGLIKVRSAESFFTRALEKRLADNLARDYSLVVPLNPLVYKATLNAVSNSHPICSDLFN